MDEHLKLWLDWEMKEFSQGLQQINRQKMKKAPLWMAVSVAGMVALGFLVGYDAAYVFRVHFPIGLGIALLILLCFWLPVKTASMKKVRPVYEKAIEELPQEDKAAFLRQMELKTYGKQEFRSSTTNYPGRLLAGAEYWLYFKDLSCRIVKTADIERVTGKEEKARVGYNVGNTRVSQKLTVAVSMVIDYKEESGKEPEKLFFESGKQFRQAVELIQKYCPRSGEFLS